MVSEAYASEGTGPNPGKQTERHMTISLFKAGNSWMAKHSDPKVKDLFGTDTLPTPFTSQADEQDVVAQIQRLNPKAKVTVQWQ